MARKNPHHSVSAGPIGWKLALLLALAAIIIGAFLSSCANKPHAHAHKHPKPPVVIEETPKHEEGLASWYGPGFRGKRTASGERFNPKALTAAHKTLPFGTKVRVVNLTNDKDVIVRINDRGPFIRGRIIDLSKNAAKTIAMLGSGTTRVRIETVTEEDILIKEVETEQKKSVPVKFIKGRKRYVVRST